MSWVRVAVASKDGSAIDQSLLQASLFSVYDVDPEGPRFVEQRNAYGASAGGGSGAVSPEFTVDELLELISDCSILIVQSLGIEAGGKMQIGWVTVYEADMPVEKALKKLSGSPLFRNALGYKAFSPRTGISDQKYLNAKESANE
jgi:predicted Fe-Mo cluster-binding NifX family protein